jgi:hypothetical protein
LAIETALGAPINFVAGEVGFGVRIPGERNGAGSGATFGEGEEEEEKGETDKRQATHE